jgi:methionyl-tRNA synthetase
MDDLDLKGGVEAAWELVTVANQYIVQTAPWSLAKHGKDAELDASLAALARCLTRLTILSFPFMPGKAADLWAALGQDAPLGGAWRQVQEPQVAGLRITKPAALFPKFDHPSP